MTLPSATDQESGAADTPAGAAATATGAATGSRPAPWNPPEWVLYALGAAYVVALAVVIFLPGGTLIDRLSQMDSGICAQLPTHSFFPGGIQLPLCSRNTGIYTGFSATFLVLLFSGRLRAVRLPVAWVAVVLGLAVMILAVDGFNSLFLDLRLPHLYQPHNLLRLATGLGTGTAMASFLLPVASGLLWRNDDDRASFANLRQLAVMLPVLLLAFLVISSQAAWTLYPVAILSTTGLVAALTLINLVFVVGLSGRQNRFTSARQVFPLVTLAVAIAVVELFALAALKNAALQAILTHAQHG